MRQCWSSSNIADGTAMLLVGDHDKEGEVERDLLSILGEKKKTIFINTYQEAVVVLPSNDFSHNT